MGSIGTLSVVMTLSIACARPTPQAVTCRDGMNCFELGSAYFVGAEPAPHVQPSDLRRAARYFELSCDRGYRRGCNVLGNLLRKGIGVPRDLVAARAFYLRACVDDETTPEACSNLYRAKRELASGE